METSPANVNDATGKNGTFLTTAQRKVLVVTKLFQLKHERLPHRGTTRNGAMTRPSRNNSARRAGVDELLWHRRAWVAFPKFRECLAARSFYPRQTRLDKLVTESKAEELQQRPAEVWPGQEHIHPARF